MRNILTTVIRATLLGIVSLGTLSGLGAQEKPGGIRDCPCETKSIGNALQVFDELVVSLGLTADETKDFV